MDKVEDLGFLLCRAHYSVVKALNRRLKEEGVDLPHSQYVILKNLHEKDGLSQQELARRLYIDTAAVKRSIDNLEKKGLVCRVQISLRENSIQITEKGNLLMPVVIACVNDIIKQIITNVPETEYTAAIEFLNRIYTVVGTK